MKTSARTEFEQRPEQAAPLLELAKDLTARTQELAAEGRVDQAINLSGQALACADSFLRDEQMPLVPFTAEQREELRAHRDWFYDKHHELREQREAQSPPAEIAA